MTFFKEVHQKMNGQQNFENQSNTTMPQSTGKGFSVAALVLGIIGAVFGWFGVLGIVALACSIVGIVLAVIGRKKSLIALGKPSGMATAGLVLSIIGASLAAIGVIACFACAACIGNAAAGVGSVL